jgi:hypothetical protein
MNFIEYFTTVHAFALFIEFFLYVNQNNPVRHVFVAMYVYLFYLFLREKFAMDQLEMDNLFMNNQCLVSCMEPKNHTHGQFV